MPFRYSIDKKLRLVRTQAWGLLRTEDWLAYNRELASDPDFDPTLDQVADFTRVTDIAIGAAYASQVAQAAPFAKGSRRACIASSDLVFGMGRVYEAHSKEGTEIMIFRTAEEAHEWLGIPPDRESVEPATGSK